MLIMPDNTETDQKISSEGYTKSEAQERLGLKHTAFYRAVEGAGVERYPRTQRTYYYNKEQIDTLAKSTTAETRRVGRPSRIEHVRHEELSVEDVPVIRLVSQEILPYVFVLNYEQRGYKNLIPAETMWSWQEIMPVLWCMYNVDAPKDIIALLGMLPLSEKLIFQILKKELPLKDLKPSDILPASKTYYMLVDAEPERTESVSLLIEHVFTYWCQENISVASIYAEVQDAKQIPLLHAMREHDFSLRPDIGSGVRRLDFDDFNISPAVQQYLKCIQDKKEVDNTMIAMPATEVPEKPSVRQPKDRVRNFSGFRPLNPDGYITKRAQFRRAVTDDDIHAILRINGSLFGPSKRTEEELLQTRRAWIEKNPEIYHVLEVDGEIVGFISMFPLAPEFIEKLITGETEVSKIQAEDILIYEPNHPVDIFVQTLGVDPSIEKEDEQKFKRYGSFLIKGIMDLFYRWGRRGIEIHAVHARSNTDYGIYTSLGLGFKEVPPPPGVHKKVFRLDVARSGQAFMMEYMNALKNYWRDRALEKSIHS